MSTKMTTKEKIAVMQAYEDGKKIQIYFKASGWTDWDVSWGPVWDWDKHDYRIKPEEEEPKRMTKRQLFEWCGKGNGAIKLKDSGQIIFTYSYHEDDENDPASEVILIRPWDSDEWVEPTVDIYERDCKGN